MVNKKIIVVNRLINLEEVQTFERLGVDIVGFYLFSNNEESICNRGISIEKLKNCVNSINQAELLIEANLEDPVLLKEILTLPQVKYLLPVHNKIPFYILDILINSDVKIITSHMNADHDDDPSWIIEDFDEQIKKQIKYYLIDILPDIENSWRYFVNESIKYPNDLQIEDINKIANTHSVVITTDFSIKNIHDIYERISHSKGIFFHLSDNVNTRNYGHYFTVSDCLKIIKEINRLPL